ncbi:50S ribosomal protein L10 [Candidatus Pacearchaeota archaeon]|jgi:large subunit ribosomal protein L10|nr:50S ribosomal protein L10 [Candidatus Pacearchaeota archaeon]|tara:strand:+ start:745 stop:1632 length:888 start_codon:yes stop_codon:yes gene_type:complete
MKSKVVEHIPERKTKSVKELIDLIKNKKTILIASIKNLPASQFQEIGKKLRDKAIIKVPKKNLIFRSIDNSGSDEVKKLKEQIKDSMAILFSDLDSFDLALELIKNKNPAKAKPGQVAPLDIEVEAGMTDLIPGPAISELGSVGLKTKVTNGKLEIIANKVIVKEGEKISQNVADVMAKLDIKPFSIGFIPLSAFDTKEKKLYLNIQIDREGTLEELKSAYGKALPFAVEIGYICEDTIKLLIGKAGIYEKVLEKMLDKEKVEEVKKDEIKEKTEEKEEVKSEENTQENKSEDNK